jgi:hypothetical protein
VSLYQHSGLAVEVELDGEGWLSGLAVSLTRHHATSAP